MVDVTPHTCPSVVGGQTPTTALAHRDGEMNTNRGKKVYDVSGKEIATLLSDHLEAGEYSLPISTLHLPKEIYLVRLISDFGVKNQKLIVQ